MTASSTTIPEIFRGLKVIDTDTHYAEPPDLWTSRAPAKYKDIVPRIRRLSDGADHWFFADEDLGASSQNNVITDGRKKTVGQFTFPRWEQNHPSSYDVEERLKAMDEDGIYAQVVYPNRAGFGGDGLGKAWWQVDDAVRKWTLSTYNDAAAEWAAASNGRLYPQALVPFWDIPAAVKEVRRIKEKLKMTGVTISETPEKHGGPDYGDKAWDPFWEACTDLELPISFHIGGGGIEMAGHWPSLDKMVGGFGRRTSVVALMLSFNNARVLASIICSGLLDRWPKLKFVSVESGIGWIPFFLEMVTYQTEEFQKTPGEWGLKRTPWEYWHDQMYASWWFEKHGPQHELDAVGVNNVLFETDYPHSTCLYPNTLERAVESLKGRPPEVVKKLMQDNAAALWKIPV